MSLGLQVRMCSTVIGVQGSCNVLFLYSPALIKRWEEAGREPNRHVEKSNEGEQDDES